MVLDPVSVGMTAGEAKKIVDEATKYCGDGKYRFQIGEPKIDYPEDATKPAAIRVPVLIKEAFDPANAGFVGNKTTLIVVIPPLPKDTSGRRLDLLCELHAGAKEQLGVDIWPSNVIEHALLANQELLGTVKWNTSKQGGVFANYKFTGQFVV